MKLIAGLRKEEHNWPRTRWVFLGTAVFLVMVNGCFLAMMSRALDSHDLSPADKSGLFTLIWVDTSLFSVFAGYCIGMAIKYWHGNVHRMLLLRLLDALEEKSS